MMCEICGHFLSALMALAVLSTSYLLYLASITLVLRSTYLHSTSLLRPINYKIKYVCAQKE